MDTLRKNDSKKFNLSKYMQIKDSYCGIGEYDCQHYFKVSSEFLIFYFMPSGFAAFPALRLLKFSYDFKIVFQFHGFSILY